MQILTTATCPACRLLNPGTAVRCDCGYDFASGTMQEPHLREGGNSREYRMGGILSVVSCCLTIAATVSTAVVVALSYGTPASIMADPHRVQRHRLSLENQLERNL